MVEQAAPRPGSAAVSGLARRVRRGLLLAAVLAPAVFAACGDNDDCEYGTCVEESGTRLIDRICATDEAEDPACELEGAAEQTSGITADSIGFRLGEQAGSLLIHMQAIADATYFYSGTFSIKVLATTREPGASQRLTTQLTWGTCGATCPAAPPPSSIEVHDEYAWVTVVADAVAPGTATLPDDAVLTLSGAGIDIADIRSISTFAEGCSIAGPVGSR